jgi:hypothetical protein
MTSCSTTSAPRPHGGGAGKDGEGPHLRALHPGQASRRVEVVATGCGQPGRGLLDDGEVLPDPQHQEVGLPPAEHHAGVAGEGPPGVEDQRSGEADGADATAGGEVGDDLFPQGAWGAGQQHGGGPHGRKEWSRRHGPAELLHDDRQLGQAVALPAQTLRNVERGPAQGAQLVPERGQFLVLGLQEVPRRGQGAPISQKRPGHVGQRSVILG